MTRQVNRVRRLLVVAALAGAAVLGGPAVAANASSGGGCGGWVTTYAGPLIAAQSDSCISQSGGTIQVETYAGQNSGFSSCTYHVALRDDTIANTVWGTNIGLCANRHTIWEFYPSPVGGHHYHVYSWYTGVFNGQTVYVDVANSAELTW
jgi:hypothetical protein